MIDFRYHLVSLVAVLLALATGIALGAGPLQGPLSERLVDQAERDRLSAAELRAELVGVQDRIEFADAYAAGTAGAVAGGRLAGRTVSIVSLPGADSGDVRGLRERVVAAGGSVVSTVALSSDLLDPANRLTAESLAEGLTRYFTAPDGAGSYQLLGAAYARAFLTRSGEPVVQDNGAIGIEAALTEAEFVRVDDEVERRAQLALVVAGDPPGDAVEGQADVAAELAGALDAGSLGTVVAGPPAAAEAGAVLAVRESAAGDDVSTVDTVDVTAGRVVTILALAEQVAGGAGQYGQHDAADGAVPETAPSGAGGDAAAAGGGR